MPVTAKDFVRPTLALIAAMAGALLCGLVIDLAAGGTDAKVSWRWIAISLLAGAGSVVLGIVGIADGRRGRLAFAGSLLLLAAVVALYEVAGPDWLQVL